VKVGGVGAGTQAHAGAQPSACAWHVRQQLCGAGANGLRGALRRAGLTIAVNFWWGSAATQQLTASPDTAHYHIRVLMAGLLQQHKQELLASIQPLDAGGAQAQPSAWAGQPHGEPSGDQAAKRHRAAAPADPQQQLSPREGWALAQLLRLLAADSSSPGAGEQLEGRGDASTRPQPAVSAADPYAAAGDLCASDATWQQRSQQAAQQATAALVQQYQQLRLDEQQATQAAQADPLGLRQPLTRLLASLKLVELLNVLYVLGGQHQQATQRLLLCALPPAAAELLTQRLEEAESVFGQLGGAATAPAAPGSAVFTSRLQFYGALYGAIDDPGAMMQHLLAGKAQLSDAVYRAVVGAVLGLGK